MIKGYLQLHKNPIDNIQSDVYLMDCMEALSQYPDNHFSLAVVDPPYGIGINVNMGRRKGDKKSPYHKFYGEDKETPTKNYFIEIKRVCQNQIIWGGNYFIENLNNSACWLCWDKGFSDQITFAQIELAWTSFKTSSKLSKFNAANNKIRIHPTQKPVALYAWIFKNYAKEGDTILDTHLGSQSSRIAAYRAGLSFTGFENDEDYFNTGCKRFETSISQLQLF